MPVGRFAGAGGGVPHSACRVAQAGNGNSTASGTGISGWLTNMVPGLARVARVRWLGGRKPYSGRPASAGSSRPTTLMLELRHDPPLDLAGGLLGADQDDAEGAAALGDVEQHVLDRAVALPRARTC